MKPSRLKKGDTIGIVSPAYWLEEGILSTTVNIFEKAGYYVKTGSASHLRDHPFAGTVENRVSELEELFGDDSVNAIICSRGGYGSTRVTDKLNYNLISNSPKIFMGYSDITAPLHSILQSTGLVTFHGPMLVSFGETVDTFAWGNMLSVLSGETPTVKQFPADLQPIVLKDGKAEGELTGGNLTLLIHLIGTKWDFDTTGKILFLEDVSEKLYSLDRMLLHLKRAGKLDNITGLIIGEMTDIGDERIPFGKTVDEIVLDICRNREIPIVSNFPCGHGIHQLTLPLGIKTKLECSNEELSFTLLEPAVI